jgi:leucyl-tRNA---protein transferase
MLHTPKDPLRFFRTAPQPCPYVPGRVEQNLFAELARGQGNSIYSGLAKAGFRRSHRIAYRPACPGCNSCVPVRVLVDEFAPSRNLRRVVKANAGLTEKWIPAVATVEQHALFLAYQESRHTDGEMAVMGFADYRAMIEDSSVETGILEFHDAKGKLRATILADRLNDGYSAVYSFFDPAIADQSPGTFLILRLIAAAQASGLPYVYLGYWISASRKMAYKARFQPQEQLLGEGWVRAGEAMA